MGAKKAFTLVELLVAMAIIAILLGLSVVGITIVQQNARDTQRRSTVNSIEIALNGRIAGGTALPADFTVATNAANTTSNVYLSATSSITLSGSMVRGASPFTTDTTATVTDYCYGMSGSIYVVGVNLEGGGFFAKTNSGATFGSMGSSGGGVTCTDANL